MSYATDEILYGLRAELRALTSAIERLTDSLAAPVVPSLENRQVAQEPEAVDRPPLIWDSLAMDSEKPPPILGIGHLCEVTHKPIHYEGRLPQAASDLRIGERVVVVSEPDERGDYHVASEWEWVREDGRGTITRKVNGHCLALVRAWSLRLAYDNLSR